LTRQLRLPYGRQTIDQQDLNAVNNVMESDWLTQGPNVFEFEEKLAHYCGAQFAVVVSNGTAALHLANLALKADAGSKVITTPISFVATCNSVLYAGSTPMFCDIIPETLNINPVAVRKCLRSNPDVVGIIPVHMGGLIADMEALSEIAKANDMWVIEDACHALGGSWLDSKGVEHRVGDCSFSDMTVFSFHPVKHITTGEGGAITTNDESLYKQLLELRSHGITKDPEKVRENHGGWYYEMHNLGYNYRITDIQAAMGISQLTNSDIWAKRRLKLVAQYDQAFETLPQVVPQDHPDNQTPCYHLYIVRVTNRKALYNHLREENIYTQVHYIPIHLQPYYQDTFGTKLGDYPEAERYYLEALSLPLFPSMTDEDQYDVIRTVREFYA
jgi:UDP-4-amino-4,6-dideoxy-N-acetyl-beta-L-altrosamine transaminase